MIRGITSKEMTPNHSLDTMEFGTLCLHLYIFSRFHDIYEFCKAVEVDIKNIIPFKMLAVPVRE